MKNKLNGKKVAVLVENGFEQVELTEPVKALKEAGAEVMIVSPENKVKGWKHVEWGDEFKTDMLLDKSRAEDFDALLLPGGVMNPDKLRMNKKAMDFVKHFMASGKPIAAICHGPWSLIETGMIQGRKMTSYPSIKTDLMNAGVQWVDQEVITDHGIVTSRKPDDIPAFNKKMIEEFAEGIHTARKKLLEQKTDRTMQQKPPVKREEMSDDFGRMNENIDSRNFEDQNEYRTPKGENI